MCRRQLLSNARGDRRAYWPASSQSGGPQSGRGRSSSDRARAHDWVLSDWALGISRPLTVRYRRGEQEERKPWHARESSFGSLTGTLSYTPVSRSRSVGDRITRNNSDWIVARVLGKAISTNPFESR